ncbi:hypothetical protein LX36DRAFT_5330 [Colletotrichum falcatum]|nr:hypothetical protein LX36DRAFT_5330 [Colletotrichum falcatum]
MEAIPGSWGLALVAKVTRSLVRLLSENKDKRGWGGKNSNSSLLGPCPWNLHHLTTRMTKGYFTAHPRTLITPVIPREGPPCINTLVHFEHGHAPPCCHFACEYQSMDFDVFPRVPASDGGCFSPCSWNLFRQWRRVPRSQGKCRSIRDVENLASVYLHARLGECCGSLAEADSHVPVPCTKPLPGPSVVDQNIFGSSARR